MDISHIAEKSNNLRMFKGEQVVPHNHFSDDSLNSGGMISQRIERYKVVRHPYLRALAFLDVGELKRAMIQDFEN